MNLGAYLHGFISAVKSDLGLIVLERSTKCHACLMSRKFAEGVVDWPWRSFAREQVLALLSQLLAAIHPRAVAQ